jgi:hypothetical protein
LIAAHELGRSVSHAPADLVPDAVPQLFEERKDEEDTDGSVVEGGDTVVVPFSNRVNRDELGSRLDDPVADVVLVVVPFLNRDELDSRLDDIVAELVFVERSLSVDLDLDLSISELSLDLLVVEDLGF